MFARFGKIDAPLDLPSISDDLKDKDGKKALPDDYFSEKGLILTNAGLARKSASIDIKAEDLNFAMRMLMSNAIEGFKYYSGPEYIQNVDKLDIKHGEG